jgi:SAM-dependent methyltransferase
MALVYKHPLLYETVMRVLYGRSYSARSQAISDLIPARASVLDLCCGPATFFHQYLRHKSVQYMGLDLSAAFVCQLQAKGAYGQVWNLRDSTPLPPADYVIIRASLYHFLPEPETVFQRMLRAARKKVIVAEPVRNIADGRHRFLTAIARRITDPGDGQSSHRFTLERLDRFFLPYAAQVENSFFIPGGREKVFVINSQQACDEHSLSLEASPNC